MIGFIGALRSGRIVCWIVRRVRIVGVGVRVVVYWSTRGRREVVRLREVSRVVGMGTGWRGAIIGAVGASGVG
jgi:hypothetical protein